MEFLTMQKKIKVLEHSFAASAGAYYNINLTKDLVPGTMYQVIDDVEYSLNEQMGLPENARFTDVVSYWGQKLDEKEKKVYYDFLSIPNLLSRYQQGEDHVFLRYWTKSALFEPMLAEQHIVMYTDEETKDVLAIAYVLDLTQEYKLEKDRKELERALAEATLNSEIIDAISKLYWLIYRIDLTDGTYEEITAGQEMHRLTGKHGNAIEVLREARKNVVSVKDQERMKAFLNPATLVERLKDTESIALEYRAASGSWHRARFIVKKRDEAGCVTNVLYVVRVIDSEKKKELEYKQKLLEALDDAQRANMAKTDFLRRMSHDIRTPLNGIQGMIAIADRYANDPQKLNECRGKVKEAVGFLTELVNSILDMNKLESGAVILEHTSFRLLDVLNEVNAISAMNVEKNDLHISFRHEDVQHIYLKGSPVHLKQILQNITGNAVKYNKSGGSIFCSTREIACENGKAVIQFTCEDTGRGMSREFMAHAFEPFAQELEDARTAYMGTGLGLPITKELVELMGGTISMESELGKGSKFTVTIPFEIDTEYMTEQTTEERQVDFDLTGCRVLLAEDNVLNMEIAKFVLEEAGMEVTPAGDGREAVDAFLASPIGWFDVICMDVMMPVMDGLTATRKIRKMNRRDAKTLPIIAMTANAFMEDREKSREAGMNAHLSKPLDEKKLLSEVRRLIQESRAVQ